MTDEHRRYSDKDIERALWKLMAEGGKASPEQIMQAISVDKDMTHQPKEQA